MCYNSITGSAPSYLPELLQLYSPSRSLRSSSHTRILKLRHFKVHKTHGFRFLLFFFIISYFSPHIWNNLPQDVRRSNSFPSFKTKLKTFLFSEHFNWVSLSFAPTVCIVFVSVHLCVCVHACGVCVHACVYVGYIYICLCLYNIIQLCIYMNIFFFLMTFTISMYMYVFNLYYSVLCTIGQVLYKFPVLLLLLSTNPVSGSDPTSTRVAWGETDSSQAATLPAGEAGESGGDREDPEGTAGEGGDDPILWALRPDPPYPAQETAQGEGGGGGRWGGASGQAHQAEEVPPQCVGCVAGCAS